MKKLPTPIALFWLAAVLGLAPLRQADAKPLIQIGVEVVEIDESKTRKLGVEWMEKLNLFESNVPAVLEVGKFLRSPLQADIHLLMDEGAADLLANPKLVTRDESTATFHAGGEIPYVTVSSLGNADVLFKPYGVQLEIHPQLQPDGMINLNLTAEVSSPDDQRSVSVSGTSVPGLRVRRVMSDLTLAPGSTLTMAGLIQNDKATLRKGVPGLMDIPLLGHLFSVRTRVTRRTSIVVFITPVVLEGGTGRVALSSAE